MRSEHVHAVAIRGCPLIFDHPDDAIADADADADARRRGDPPPGGEGGGGGRGGTRGVVRCGARKATLVGHRHGMVFSPASLIYLGRTLTTRTPFDSCLPPIIS